jgi:protoheme IX farnesyltransferase
LQPKNILLSNQDTQGVSSKPSKFKDWMLFTKMRLAFLVILSAFAGYLFAGGSFDRDMLLLILGGIFVTGASNGMNQIIEKELDAKMARTKNRPLPTNRMSLKEAYTLVALFLIIGLTLMYFINGKVLLWSFLSFVLYSFVYTPLKLKTSWSVFIGAIPGAFPPFIGALAELDAYTQLAGILFLVQFMWQFPHFWAIAWVLYDDYKHGGFSLLPAKNGRSKESAFPILVYTLLLVPFSLLPWVLDMTGNATLILGSLFGLIFYLYAYKLYLTCSVQDARKLMFASFVYLPLIQFLYVLDKV